MKHSAAFSVQLFQTLAHLPRLPLPMYMRSHGQSGLATPYDNSHRPALSCRSSDNARKLDNTTDKVEVKYRLEKALCTV